jgi:starch synthase
MSKLHLLYVSSEIDPFLSITKASEYLKKLPIKMQDMGMEIRILVPRFGNINERKNRLHEVVRLSGTSISVGDDEKPLIIKVASMPSAKIQVYFIDNEDFFQRKSVFHDKEGKFFEDNDERAIFFCKGAIETVRKLGWAPDVVHCSDWFTAFLPLYLKTIYKNDLLFKDSKIIFSVFNNDFEHTFTENVAEKAQMPEITEEMLKNIKTNDFTGFIKLGMQYSDKILKAEEDLSEKINEVFNEFPEKTIGFIESNVEFQQFFDFYTELATA